jgi:hypothetical protein
MQAWENRDDLALGHQDWAAYIQAEYGTGLLKLDKAVRRQWALALKEAGLSTREIAPVINASQATASRDARESNDSPRASPREIADAATSPEEKLWDDLRAVNNKLERVLEAIKGGTPVTSATVQDCLQITVGLVKEILNIGAEAEAR